MYEAIRRAQSSALYALQLRLYLPLLPLFRVHEHSRCCDRASSLRLHLSLAACMLIRRGCALYASACNLTG